MQKCRLLLALCLLVAVLVAGCGRSGSSKPLRLATTTSLQDSGLLAGLLPAFQERSGREVEVTAVGSGKALEQLQAGQADVAITHAPELEQAALAAGRVGRRTPFMHNDFVLVGPKEQAAGIARDAGFVVTVNAGMGATLERASSEGAFALTDRSTFLARRNDLDLVIVFQGDDALRNTYSVLEPAGGGEAAQGARALVELVRSPEGRALIGQFGVEKLGEPLFTPER